MAARRCATSRPTLPVPTIRTRKRAIDACAESPHAEMVRCCDGVGWGAGLRPSFQVTINLSVAQASQEEAVRFAEMVKGILEQETYLSAVGKGHGY